MVGLLGKVSLAEDTGLLIVGTNSIHTFFMRFPIDVVFISKNGEVTSIYHSLVPWRITKIHWRAKSCLELPAGRVERTGLRVGDNIQVC